ncbi:hypothetical protein [uncultured Ruegeria sp.]|uniref:hypothetical protein n=1 Tax=uncultured Ruegeria sp. TaxID=259304 RepID=UPI0026019A0C|nr:hypothetical protein [uncultured Ruegeria sp.]
MTKSDLIRSIKSLAELDGYEAQAKQRGITGDELRAIHEMRQKLTPKRKRRGRG